MTEQEQLEELEAHRYHGSFTPSEDTVFSIEYTCVHQTKHTIYSPCIGGLIPPDDCGCGKKQEIKQ